MVNMQSTMIVRHYQLSSESVSQKLMTPQHALVMSVSLNKEREPVLALLEPEPLPVSAMREIQQFRDGDLIAPGINRRYIGATLDGEKFCHWFEVLS